MGNDGDVQLEFNLEEEPTQAIPKASHAEYELMGSGRSSVSATDGETGWKILEFPPFQKTNTL